MPTISLFMRYSQTISQLRQVVKHSFADANEKHSRNPFLVDGMVPDDNGTETAAVSQSVACG